MKTKLSHRDQVVYTAQIDQVRAALRDCQEGQRLADRARKLTCLATELIRLEHWLKNKVA